MFKCITLLCLLASVELTEASTIPPQELLDQIEISGGLIVHVGCGQGNETSALYTGEPYIVQGLDLDHDDIEIARSTVDSQNAAITFVQWQGAELPYRDNMVNLLIVSSNATVAIAEIDRVLTPGGTALVDINGQWTNRYKARPQTIGEWTHYLCGPENNPVAQDTVVGPPTQHQWLTGPKWSRSHETVASVNALVSANGKIFYVIDAGESASVQLPAKWMLIARDAFNGKLLWQRELPDWHPHLWPLKSGPATLPRRLVAKDDVVYVPIGFERVLHKLDASTGEILKVFEGTTGTDEILLIDNQLILSIRPLNPRLQEYRREQAYAWGDPTTVRSLSGPWGWKSSSQSSIQVLDANSGTSKWETTCNLAPISLTADSERVYYHSGKGVVCRDLVSGTELWASSGPSLTYLPPSGSLTMMVYQDVVLLNVSSGKPLFSFDTTTGIELWQDDHPYSTHYSPNDISVVDGLVWSQDISSRPTHFIGRDPRTGEIIREFQPDSDVGWFHPRCSRGKATEKHLILSRTGTELLNVKTGDFSIIRWTRGGCLYGLMPCNGLIYNPPNPCMCHQETKLNGFYALAPTSSVPRLLRAVDDPGLRVEGPAYTETSPSETTETNAWPAFRHDVARSGRIDTTLSSEINVDWQTTLPASANLTALTVAQQKCFVADKQNNMVYALDISTGNPIWSFVANSRVDSPPTIYKDRVYFGGTDGWVYCLNTSTGALIWKYLAAPREEYMMVRDRLESVWPVHGSVLIENDTLIAIAGRSIYIDGGIRIVRLNPLSGQKTSETILQPDGYITDSEIKANEMPPGLPDILSSDGNNFFMRSMVLTHGGNIVNQSTSHLFSPNGFLDDSWMHRAYWLYGSETKGGWKSWFRAGQLNPGGRILVFDEDQIYGYARKTEFKGQSTVFEYELFAARKPLRDNLNRLIDVKASEKSKSIELFGPDADYKHLNVYMISDWTMRKTTPDMDEIDYQWKLDGLPFHVRAMAMAGDKLIVAGPPDVHDEEQAFALPYDPDVIAQALQQEDAFAGNQGGILWIVDAASGKPLAKHTLSSPPVFDGLVVAYEKIFIATMDGTLICFKETN